MSRLTSPKPASVNSSSSASSVNETTASAIKDMFDAYVAEGFTRDEALRIVMALLVSQVEKK